MSNDKLSNWMWVLLRAGAVAVLVVLAVWAGLWLGERSAPVRKSSTPEQEKEAVEPKAVALTGDALALEAPPLFFFANVPAGGDWRVALEEMGMAAGAGVHQYVVPVALPWAEFGPAPNAALERLETVLTLDPRARMLLYVKLDPPDAWRSAHPDAVAKVGDRVLPYVCVASERWLEDACKGLGVLINALTDSDLGPRVLGYVIACLEEGRWYQSEGYDTSPANMAGFRRWLRLRYGDDAALQAAWVDEAVTVDTAAIPAMPDSANTHQVFFALPEMQRQVDFLQYVSDQTADCIAALAGYIKEATNSGAEVIAPYGYSLELGPSAAGHYALMRIIDSDIDGFVSPVSYFNRGLAGAGGPMGPVDSVMLHGKQWYLIDDTRTGIAHDPASGAITRLEGLRLEHVYSVQQRNFAAALSHGLGLFWTDPEGQGWLHDLKMWDRFGTMYTVYKEYSAFRTVLHQRRVPGRTWPTPDTFLVLVVDEQSRFYQQCDARLNRIVLTHARDCVLHASVPARFCLLQDVLEERVPQAAVYLFLNAFRLQEGTRERLHELLARQGAAAIWLYAPGYIAGSAAVENVSATTRMGVKAFDGPATSGSIYQLAGTWINKNEEYGEAIEWAPLFYVDDEGVDVIASYRDSGQPSAAIAFFEEGWASIFLAEPSLTPALLREILHILGQRLYFQETTVKHFDATYFGPNFFGVHAQEAGERLIHLGPERLWNVQDLLVPEIGWLQKRSFMLPLKAGETRLLKLTPADDFARR